jgi:signal transduction histidine kinase
VTIGAERAGANVRIWVQDQGAGVPDSEKAYVFEKFYRGSNSTSVPSGTGLGLAIAREIVRTHAGTLTVEDAVPNGARFVMTLPAATPEAE